MPARVDTEADSIAYIAVTIQVQRTLAVPL
jgi:hypothetical protein